MADPTEAVADWIGDKFQTPEGYDMWALAEALVHGSTVPGVGRAMIGEPTSSWAMGQPLFRAVQPEETP
jgi:hypothetical protein